MKYVYWLTFHIRIRFKDISPMSKIDNNGDKGAYEYNRKFLVRQNKITQRGILPTKKCWQATKFKTVNL